MEQALEIIYTELADQDAVIKETRRALLVDTQKARIIISRVLHTIRRSLTKTESAEFISRLPDYLKVLYVTDWTPTEKEIQVKHLDEFTEEMLRLDEEQPQRVFHKEVDALTAVITVLSLLDRQVSLLDLPSFSYSFKRELEETMLETAA